MGKLANQVFFRITLALAIICFTAVFFVGRGTAEFVVLVISGIINCICVIACLLSMIIRGKKK